MALTDSQIELYSRQIILPELGGIGQRRLLSGSCLLMGDGPAIECAASYLAGAGVGRVDLGRGARATMGFAPLEDRNPDVAPGTASADALRGAYDVCIDSTSGRASTGRARLGEIAIRTSASASEVRVVPAAIGCIDCCPTTLELAGETDPIDAASAGAMAALAALLWLGDIPGPTAPKRLHLPRGAATWERDTLGPTTRCPRPCRP